MLKIQSSLVFIMVLLTTAHGQKAFLLTSSVGYYNYRQQANVLQFYHILKQYGFEDQHVLLSFPENIGCCEKNPLQGAVSFRDHDYTNINRQLETDYKYYSISAEALANVMVLKYKPEIINKQRIKLDEQPYLVYLTGHGGDFYFKIRERQAVVAQNMKDVLSDLGRRKPEMPVFILIDSCSAITPYEGVEEQNIIALGSSSLDEKSLSMGYDKLVNCPKSDEFTYYLSQLVQNSHVFKTNFTIKKLYEYMDVKKLKVHAKLVSKSPRNARRNLGQFLTRSSNVRTNKLEMPVPSGFADFLSQQIDV